MKYDFQINMSADDTLSLILRHVTPKSRVLEFGPATGYMTRYMKEQLGCTIFCVEIDREAAEVTRNYCDKMIVEDIDNLKWIEELSGESFTHIIFADVLEHLRNPLKILELAANFLVRNGTIITSIPNIGHSAVIMDMLEGKFDYRSLGILDDTHIKFFTRKSISELIDKSGLCPVEWQAVSMLPEQTEFKQNYSNFPAPLKEFMENRKDAHIYQFITVSKKKEDVKEACSNGDNIVANHIYNEFLQIFWEDEDGFTEKNSVKISFEYDKDFQIYDIPLPTLTSGRLRLDPGTKPAFIEIKSIEIYSQNDNLLANYSANNGFAGLELLNALIPLSNKISQLVCNDNDPEIILDGLNLTGKAKDLRLRIEMRAEQISSVLATAIFKQNEELLKAKSVIKFKEDQYEEIISSRSWRITAPLRYLKKLGNK